MDAATANALKKNLNMLKSIEAASVQFKLLPAQAANYYGNGGDGVGQGVVGDRFQGAGNSRFAPLSKDYEEWKEGHSKSLNKGQKTKFGHRSNYVKSSGGGSVLPILVLTGALRASVLSRQNKITQSGDTAYVEFNDLPEYAIFLHEGTSKMPARSPVEPNEEDLARVKEFVVKRIKAITGQVNKGATAFGGAQPRIIT